MEQTLIKINQFNSIAKDTLDEWIYFLKNEEIKESFTAKGLKEAQEKLSIMKLPEDEQEAYEHNKDDLYYQASMFESSYGDGYYEGKIEASEQMILKMAKQGVIIAYIIERAIAGIKLILFISLFFILLTYQLLVLAVKYHFLKLFNRGSILSDNKFKNSHYWFRIRRFAASTCF